MGHMRALLLAVLSFVAPNATQPPPDTGAREAASRAAIAALTAHQSRGYWLTTYTSDTRFEQPAPELNTFTNALLVDLLDPVAEEPGVAALTAKARAFLSSQIEEDGLVRYHGRPGAFANLGFWTCHITQDPDDTALAWRIAPLDDTRLRTKALATMTEYRAPNGLYRTWLAPQSQYQCINPGSDPNPTDIGIQLNIHVLLAGVDPPAATALCDAMQREVGKDENWVYYSTKAPLLPLLRLVDVRAAGCALDIAPQRLRTDVAAQAPWIEVGNLVTRFEGAEARLRDRKRAAELLAALSAEDFAAVKREPPLLYHNDFSASVKRFYWSEDVGYALWLRLHRALASAAPAARETASR